MSVYVIFGIYLAASAIPVATVFIWRRRMEKTRRSPLTEKLLRGPGESLRRELDDAYWDLSSTLFIFPTVPLVFYVLSSGAKQSWFSTTSVSNLISF